MLQVYQNRLQPLLVCSFLVCILQLGGIKSAQGETLYVFLQTSITTKALQKLLSTSLDGVEIKAFGRERDFKRNVKAGGWNAIMARTPVLEALRLKPQLRATKNHQVEEPLFILGASRLPRKKLSEVTLGVLDLLGRQGTTKFFEDLLEIPGKLQCMRVAKVEDLLSLYHFNSVDVLLVAESDLLIIRSRTKLNLVETKLSIGIGLPAVVSTVSSVNLLNRIKKLPKEVNLKLGVHSWRLAK